MSRTITALIVIVWVVGCQSPVQNRPEDQARLTQRLSEIEQIRLAAMSPGGRLSDQEGKTSAQGFALANRGVAGAGAAIDARAETGPGVVLTLGDLGQDPYAQGARGDSEARADESEQAEKYLHKQPLSTFWDNVKRDVKDMPHDLWHDTKRVYTNPVSVGLLAAGVGGSIAVKESGPDDTVEDHYRPGHHTFSDGWRDFFDAYGNPGTHFAIAGAWYVLGEQLQDDKTYNVSKTLASALIINGISTYAGQAASWDRAPNGSWGTWPSGHTSSSFCIASVMDEAYGHVVGVPMYGLATLVAMERLDDRNHYFSDVVMGGVLGLVVGHSVASGRDPEFFGWKILPYANPEGSSGVAFLKSM
jgi:hypothetical protein